MNKQYHVFIGTKEATDCCYLLKHIKTLSFSIYYLQFLNLLVKISNIHYFSFSTIILSASFTFNSSNKWCQCNLRNEYFQFIFTIYSYIWIKGRDIIKSVEYQVPGTIYPMQAANYSTISETISFVRNPESSWRLLCWIWKQNWLHQNTRKIHSFHSS